MKYLLYKFKRYQEVWGYVFNHLSLYEIAYEIMREAKCCLFYSFLNIIFYGTEYIKDAYIRFLENLYFADCLEIIG